MIILNNDFRYLIKGYNSNKEKDYKGLEHHPSLKKVFDDIAKEHKVYISGAADFVREKALFEIEEMSLRYKLIVRVLTLYNDTEDVEVLGILSDLGMNYNEFEPVGSQLDNIQNELKTLRNALNIKELKFKKRYLKEDEEPIEKSNENIIEDLDAKALSLETNLELGYKINIKKTSIIRWENLIAREELKFNKNG